ncbi:hypothetical protein NIES4071_69320 [Calothrix sp. NIES-4071]|nr:hypothetical protein NIES4071_69320 [Calothrix sp. NIES-4071]BAZ61209.1 hypothetical protein NIES4105_69270 [Calothrix sp. NIES-4105]
MNFVWSLLGNKALTAGFPQLAGFNPSLQALLNTASGQSTLVQVRNASLR